MGLHLRFVLPLIAVFVFAALLGWWAGSQLLAKALEGRQLALIERTADLLASGRFPLTPVLLERVALMIDAQVLLSDSDGQVVWTSASLSEPPVNLPTPSHGRAVLDQQPHLFATRAINAAQDQRFAGVTIAMSMADLQAAVREAALILGAAAIAAVALLTWLANRLAAGITRPLRQIAATAREVAAGARRLPDPAPGAPPEITALATVLGEMVERLHGYEAEAAAQARLAGLGAMAARVAHEVRNPLTAIKMQLQLLEEDLPAERRAGMAPLLSEIRRLQLLVDGIVDRGQVPRLRLAPTDLNSVADEVCALFRPQLAHRHIQLDRDGSLGLPPLPLDPDQAKQMLTNLLVNARDALPSGGRILVCTGAEQQGLSLSVHDDGPGLSPARLDTILSGADPAQAGIGLRLTAELAERQGGRLQVVPGLLGGAGLALRFRRTDPSDDHQSDNEEPR